MGRSQYKEWRVQLINQRTGSYINDDAGVCNVLTAGSPAEVTIYTDDRGTAASNPMTFTDGAVHFYTASTVTSVDLSILTTAGQACFVEGLTPSNQKVLVNTEKREQLLVVPFSAQTAETDTGFDLPANMLLSIPYLKVTTVDATETIDFGILSSETGGDANGFIAAASVATAGIVLPVQVTNGANEAYVSTFTLGALLGAGRVGTDVATDNGMAGIAGYLTDGTAESITYTGSAGSDTAAGYLCLPYTVLF